MVLYEVVVVIQSVCNIEFSLMSRYHVYGVSSIRWYASASAALFLFPPVPAATEASEMHFKNLENFDFRAFFRNEDRIKVDE